MNKVVKLRIPEDKLEFIEKHVGEKKAKQAEYMKIYQEENKEKLKGYRKKFNKENRNKINEKRKDYRRINPVMDLYHGLKSRAKRNNIEFTIDVDDIFIPTHCPVLGIKLEINDKPFTASSPSIDRINPRVGYVKGNIKVVSWRANDLKGNGTIEEFEAILRYMKTELMR